MKVAQKTTARTDPRLEPLPLQFDDAGLARQVQSAPSAAAAWKLLDLPGDRDAMDPDVLARLLASATELVETSDAIGLGLKHFGELAEGEAPPPAWVDRMVELHVQELEGYWRLDDLAHEGLKEGGWTMTQPGREPPADEPAARVAQRARWQVEHLAPPVGTVLAIDKLRHLLDREEAITLDSGVASVQVAARGLVAGVVLRHFATWATRRTT